jgi:hypothetical protein
MEEQEEINKSIELAELVKPDMKNGLDLSLFTQKEVDLMQELEDEHNRLFRKRAVELRFYPDTLNKKEESATFRCMTYEELKPFYQIVAIQEKNRKLQQMLATKKVEIRRYCRMTRQLSEAGSIDEIGLPDISIASITQNYFSIMRRQGEKTYEIAYYFLSEEHRQRVIEIYASSISKDAVLGVPNNVRAHGEIDQ